MSDDDVNGRVAVAYEVTEWGVTLRIERTGEDDQWRVARLRELLMAVLPPENTSGLYVRQMWPSAAAAEDAAKTVARLVVGYQRTRDAAAEAAVSGLRQAGALQTVQEATEEQDG